MNATMLGTSDEVLQCECCGKPDLKKTIVLTIGEDSDPVYYGSTCAAWALKGRGIKIAGPKLQKLAERVAAARSDIANQSNHISRLEAMIAAPSWFRWLNLASGILR